MEGGVLIFKLPSYPANFAHDASFSDYEVVLTIGKMKYKMGGLT